MAAPVPPRGGARGSAASPSRSARFRGVGRDKMASPPPVSAARPGRSHGRASSTSRERGGLAHGLCPKQKLRARTRTREAKEVSRADEPCYITPGNRAAGQSHLFPRALSRQRARCLRRTQGRTPALLSRCGPPLRTRAGGHCRARGGGTREGETAGALPAAS